VIERIARSSVEAPLCKRNVFPASIGIAAAGRLPMKGVNA
jgi:hypothetical protein